MQTVPSPGIRYWEARPPTVERGTRRTTSLATRHPPRDGGEVWGCASPCWQTYIRTARRSRTFNRTAALSMHRLSTRQPNVAIPQDERDHGRHDNWPRYRTANAVELASCRPRRSSRRAIENRDAGVRDSRPSRPEQHRQYRPCMTSPSVTHSSCFNDRLMEAST